MKTLRRITVLSLLMFSAVTAQADGIDIKVKGQWDFAFGWVDNAQF